jgi:hypothetical protein
MVSTIDAPFCLSSKIVTSNVIIDTGALFCILPHQSDFVTYASSKMKIKDLSSSNQVAGEGLIHWSLHNTYGTVVTIELTGYHISNTDVHLISPQVLIPTLGGHALLNNQGMVSLDDGTVLSGNYCPCTSNLPMVPLALSTSTWYCFWSDAFGYSVQAYNEIVDIKSVLHQKNSNRSSSQKEVLLWYQRLLHASTNWIQTLMQDRKWLPNTGYPDAALHSGPFIVTKSRALTCDISNMKCAACLFAKASTQSPSNMTPCLRQNLTHSNLIILLLAIVFPLTSISLLFPVASHIHLVKNELDTHATACLLTTQVARYLIFHSIQTMLAKQYNVPSALNQWHGMKGSGSRHTIRITEFLLLPTSRSIARYTTAKVFIQWGRCQASEWDH